MTFKQPEPYSLWDDWCRWVAQYRIRHNIPVPDEVKEVYPDLFPEFSSAIIEGEANKE